MASITVALVVFILLSVALPALVQNKTQFYIAVAFTALAILVSPLAFVATFFGFLMAIFQVLAFIALVLCAGGLEPGEFAEHMVNAYSAMRHGENSKPIIVPRTGEMPKSEPTSPAIIVPPPAAPPSLESIPIEPPSSESKPDSI